VAKDVGLEALTIHIYAITITGRKLVGMLAGYVPECDDKARAVPFGMQHLPKIFFVDSVIMDFSHSFLLSVEWT
jgi:hypothetical protein